jgi:hypothetical protein
MGVARTGSRIIIDAGTEAEDIADPGGLQGQTERELSVLKTTISRSVQSMRLAVSPGVDQEFNYGR